MQEIGRIIDQLTFPLNVAAGLEARGFDPGTPKCVVSPESRALYEKIVAELRALFERHGLPRGADPSTSLGMTSASDESRAR